jgi:hypothetical protein
LRDPDQGQLHRCGAKPLLHLFVSHESGLLKYGTPASHYNEVGDASHLKAGGEPGIGFGVNLENDCFTCHVSRCPRDLGSRGAAGSTPIRPEVDEHRHLRIANNVIEHRRVDGERLSKRTKL